MALRLPIDQAAQAGGGNEGALADLADFKSAFGNQGVEAGLAYAGRP